MPELRARFGVTRLAVFGSMVRDTAKPGSDVDVLVAFDGPATSSCARKVLANVAGLDKTAFLKSELTYDATLRNLELLGEAATHVPSHVREAHPEVPWRLIVATRSRLIHGYLGIDDDTVWSIVRDDVPVILPQLEAIERRYGA